MHLSRWRPERAPPSKILGGNVGRIYVTTSIRPANVSSGGIMPSGGIVLKTRGTVTAVAHYLITPEGTGFEVLSLSTRDTSG